MWKYTIKIDGMVCGMCEAHVNAALRRACNAKKVSASRRKGEAVVISADELEEEILRKAVEDSGYRVDEIRREL